MEAMMSSYPQDKFETNIKLEIPEIIERDSMYRLYGKNSNSNTAMGKKVSVKHYLNFKIKQNLVHVYDGEYDAIGYTNASTFPLYVQITFNRKTTTVRSATRLFLSEEEFIEKQHDVDFVEITNREIKFITFHIERLYQYSLQSFGQEYHLRKEELQRDKRVFDSLIFKYFEEKNVINGFVYSDNHIDKYIDSLLYDEILSFIKKIEKSDAETSAVSRVELLHSEYINSFIDILNSTQMRLEPLKLLTFLERRNQKYSVIRSHYSSEIWNFSIYYEILAKDTMCKYSRLGATILDFIDGDFREVFLQKFRFERKTASSILYDIEKLLHLRKII
ncbi:hypothetical protein VB796_14685 [Arcicella sp. LKC2W]|uniref:hypothetical protein n=1 Tax=Arcicella sp. LKC2W TaxID=2984198 RepID=UPI002B1EAE5B|nr:hypothetical protein [Arcicella sp. LKC2W]MEA5460299.1 hypothetical protein [Arcicella sp. LKC2W]